MNDYRERHQWHSELRSFRLLTLELSAECEKVYESSGDLRGCLAAVEAMFAFAVSNKQPPNESFCKKILETPLREILTENRNDEVLPNESDTNPVREEMERLYDTFEFYQNRAVNTLGRVALFRDDGGKSGAPKTKGVKRVEELIRDGLDNSAICERTGMGASNVRQIRSRMKRQS